jgi:hypothetical protein
VDTLAILAVVAVLGGLITLAFLRLGRSADDDSDDLLRRIQSGEDVHLRNVKLAEHSHGIVHE